MPKTREARETQEIQGLQELGSRRKWQFNTVTNVNPPVIMASRKFHYRCGATAWLWVQHALDMSRPVLHTDTPLHTLGSWEAGLSVPFSAGPETSMMDRRLDPARDWALSKEQLLQAPLDLEKASLGTDVARVLRAIDRHGNSGWYLLSVVFDLDGEHLDYDGLRRRLVDRVAPAGVPRSVA